MGREPESWVSQIRRGVVELVVLGMLSRESMYGSQLVETLSRRPELAISAGTVYPLLARLRKAGLIESTWQESPVGPPRKYYKLTGSGREALLEMSNAWNAVSSAVGTILTGGTA